MRRGIFLAPPPPLFLRGTAAAQKRRPVVLQKRRIVAVQNPLYITYQNPLAVTVHDWLAHSTQKDKPPKGRLIAYAISVLVISCPK